MLFDFQQSTMVGGVVSFPDFPYSATPLAPGNLKETISITGQASHSISLTGSVDDQEQ